MLIHFALTTLPPHSIRLLQSFQGATELVDRRGCITDIFSHSGLPSSVPRPLWLHPSYRDEELVIRWYARVLFEISTT